jgi:hypothetical protein
MAVVVEMAVEVARSVAVAVDRAFETATVAVEDTGNNQPNYHIFIGVIDASLLSSFVVVFFVVVLVVVVVVVVVVVIVLIVVL